MSLTSNISSNKTPAIFIFPQIQTINRKTEQNPNVNNLVCDYLQREEQEPGCKIFLTALDIVSHSSGWITGSGVETTFDL